MSIFSGLDQLVSETVDAINADIFNFIPMTRSPNGPPKEDTSRAPIVSAIGIFDYVEAAYGLELGVRKSYREANDLRALQTGREPLLSVDRKLFPTLESEPKQGDVIKFVERPELPTFEVVSVKRDGLSRLVLQLVHRGSQA